VPVGLINVLLCGCTKFVNSRGRPKRVTLEQYKAQSGTFVPVWTIEIQTVIEDVDKILDAIMEVHPLSYGRYQRNASISAVGMETAQPEAG